MPLLFSAEQRDSRKRLGIPIRGSILTVPVFRRNFINGTGDIEVRETSTEREDQIYSCIYICIRIYLYIHEHNRKER